MRFDAANSRRESSKPTRHGEVTPDVWVFEATRTTSSLRMLLCTQESAWRVPMALVRLFAMVDRRDKDSFADVSSLVSLSLSVTISAWLASSG